MLKKQSTIDNLNEMSAQHLLSNTWLGVWYQCSEPSLIYAFYLNFLGAISKADLAMSLSVVLDEEEGEQKKLDSDLNTVSG